MYHMSFLAMTGVESTILETSKMTAVVKKSELRSKVNNKRKP